MIELCRHRVPSGEFHVHDLADRLDWLPDDSMDLVLFALALEYVDDRTSVLRELRRVLRPDGALMLSRQHPTGDWLRHRGSYFDVRVIEECGARAGGCGSGWRHWNGRTKNYARQAFSSNDCSNPDPRRKRPTSTETVTSVCCESRRVPRHKGTARSPTMMLLATCSSAAVSSCCLRVS
jgi:SAM-dependent methyltransferase